MSDLIEHSGAPDTSAERAQRAFDEVHRDPLAADVSLREVLDDGSSTAHARAVAWWGLARLHHDAGRFEQASREFVTALDLALAAGLPSEAAQIRMSWSFTLVVAGDRTAALQQLALAEPEVDGARRGRLLTQRASLLTTIGDTDAAVADFERALTLLRADGDELGEIRLLLNRAVALLQVGRTREAQRDLERSLAMAERSEQHLLVAMVAHNLGYLDFLLGRVPKALAAFALARRRYAGLGSPGRINAALDSDECTLLLAAGFPQEAEEIALRLIDDAAASGNALQLAEGCLLLARSLATLGDHDRALANADRAAVLFRDTGRTPWAAMAEYVGAMALAGGDPVGAMERLRHAADTLRSLGWQAEAAEVQVRLGMLALRIGDSGVARRALADAAAVHRRAAARTRAAAWHATALLHVLDDRPVSARRAIDAGLRVVDVHRAALGASDMRARASADGVELAALGLRLALATGRPSDVLLAAERWRAGALAERASAIAGETSIDHDLAELRRLGSELRG
ncbi:MAG: hypothetical protein JWM12_1427, partial [Ilumatobacteraceae bacterium]|nr:hypothetical protein [Ilumatobacteraceae bacterium]